MNTDLRRSIFAALMGAGDAMDAADRLARLNLKGAQQTRECLRVLLECCLQEREYNTYYLEATQRYVARVSLASSQSPAAAARRRKHVCFELTGCVLDCTKDLADDANGGDKKKASNSASSKRSMRRSAHLSLFAAGAFLGSLLDAVAFGKLAALAQIGGPTGAAASVFRHIIQAVLLRSVDSADATRVLVTPERPGDDTRDHIRAAVTAAAHTPVPSAITLACGGLTEVDVQKRAAALLKFEKI